MIPILILLGLMILFTPNLKAMIERIVGEPVRNSPVFLLVIFIIALLLLLIQTCN